MSFNVRKAGNSFKLNYIGDKGRVINFNKLPAKDKLQTMDFAYLGQPFVNIASKFQDTRSLDFASFGQPFYVNNNAYSINTSKIDNTANHKDVQNWLNTVYWNGGTVSSSTISALNIFCNAIDNAGLRNKFYRLNLFCGNNLQACLVPIYVGPTNYSAGGIQTIFGYASDINFNFVSSDYNETGSNGGLIGNGSSKGLFAGLLPNSMNDGYHLSIFNCIPSPSVSRHMIGCDNAFDSGWTTFNIDYGGSNVLRSCLASSYGSQGDTSPTSAFFGLCSSSRSTGSSQILYKNGLQETGSVSSVVPTYQTFPAYGVAIFATNRKGTLAGFGADRLGAYSIGNQMNSTEVSTYYNIIKSFQVSLNRNV
jgi:hypothetical protein